MAILKLYKFILLCIVVNVAFFYATYIEYERFRLSLYHLLFGIVPLSYQFFMIVKHNFKKQQ